MKKIYILGTTIFSLLLLVIMMMLLKPDNSVAAMSSVSSFQDVTAEPDSADLIIQFSPDKTIIRSITFTQQISGLEALQLTGLDIITTSFGEGTAVCSIGGVGCPAENCFECSSNSWLNSFWDGSDWQTYWVGADSTVITDTSVDGWRFGPWGSGELPPATPLLAVPDALDWLASQQITTTGGYGSVSSGVESMLAIGSNGLKASQWRAGENSPSLGAYILGEGTSFANSNAAKSGKLALAVTSAGGCWPEFAAQPADYYDPATGSYAEAGGDHAFAMLGTRAMSGSLPITATQYLKNLQQSDGGWGWLEGFDSDSNSTAIAVQALVAGGEAVTSTEIVSALNWLKTTQNSDGGFLYDPNSIYGTDSDTNSTAYVVQAIYAAGQDPVTGTWVISSTNPISYLLDMQLPDGSFEWQKDSGLKLLATQQTIPALLGRGLPYEIVDINDCYSIVLPLVIKE